MARTPKQEQYLCVSAYVRALEPQLLTGADLSRMIDADTNVEALRILSEHGYPETADSMESLEASLRSARDAALESLTTFLPDQGILDFFRLRYDYHNAKVALKAFWTGEDARRLLLGGGQLEEQTLYQLIHSGEDEQLPQPLQDTVKLVRETVGATGDPQKGDFLLDRAYYAQQQALAAASKSQFLQNYICLLTDVANLQSLVRVIRMGKDAALLAEALIPGGSVSADALQEAAHGSGVAELFAASPLEEAAALGAAAAAGESLTAFEKACDNAVTRFLQTAILIPYGLEPVVAYLAAREQEQRNIRIVISGRLAGLPAETIRERMRETYA